MISNNCPFKQREFLIALVVFKASIETGRAKMEE
jgi:hypothetical protein